MVVELRDDAARATALAVLDRSFLVEAGAGSGKTAVMAGRVAMLLAGGAAPRSIAAVTFTELAAGELLQRVRAFVDALVAGDVPAEMVVALPAGLSEQQRGHLVDAAATIDQVTCSTIHGFCQRLIMPYPVEANIDPGAAVMDRDHADQVLQDLGDQWLWSELDGGADSLLAQLVANDASGSIKLVRDILGQVSSQRALTVAPAQPLAPFIAAFVQCCADLEAFISTCGVDEPETTRRAACYTSMANDVTERDSLSGHIRLARLQACVIVPELCTGGGAFPAYKFKGKWEIAAVEAGHKKPYGAALFDQANALVWACEAAWIRIDEEVAATVLEQLVGAVRPLLGDYQRYKRAAGLLDFDDLIHAARDLLRDHDAVREALRRRYLHVMVDEFQDTDPLQSEILWRLCGEAGAGVAAADWRSFTIRPGALFLVGDPKQAIYRFRGADIAAFNAARSAFAARGDVLSIATNFRSSAPILDFVNQRFEAHLNAEGQPGFTPLDEFHAAVDGHVCVAALDVAVPSADGKPSATAQRDAEADAVAALCASLIGNRMLPGRHGAASRLCQAGDIALLAPTGSDLWRYEEALERNGIAVATQAGKGFYRRQEVQDLIAICRVLADSRDTIALGALLRGPLVGLTEEALLDIAFKLPPQNDRPELASRLNVRTDLAHIGAGPAHDMLATLQALRRHANATTPHLLLAQAIEALRVRPILLQRHHGRAERALANVDKFLAISLDYSVQGLAAFAAAMTLAWTDEARAAEGQPDAQEDAVTLYTMHAAKGLEWPVVVPINTMTRTKSADSVFCERSEQRLCCQVFGSKPSGYADAYKSEAAELARERIRLWYVAATRARELLVLPRLNVAPVSNAWIALLDLGLAALPAMELAPAEVLPGCAPDVVNTQTDEVFRREAANIAAAAPVLRWRAPSRAEGEGSAVVAMQEETPAMRIALAEQPAVRGGRERGLVMHKLFEEVLTGEASNDPTLLCQRAAALIAQIGGGYAADRRALSAAEIAGCVVRTLQLPEIIQLQPGLVAEFAVYGAQQEADAELVTAGIADAITFTADGKPHTIIDWKSDVAPSAATLQHYRAQVDNYLEITGARRGLIVLATSGQIIEVARAVQA